jgi:hypothetical protein
MEPTFSAGDVALLDQTAAARTQLDPNGYYVVKTGGCGIIRRLRAVGSTLYLIADDSLDRPAGWQIIQTQGRQITQLIRARAYFPTPLYEWNLIKSA